MKQIFLDFIKENEGNDSLASWVKDQYSMASLLPQESIQTGLDVDEGVGIIQPQGYTALAIALNIPYNKTDWAEELGVACRTLKTWERKPSVIDQVNRLVEDYATNLLGRYKALIYDLEILDGMQDREIKDPVTEKALEMLKNVHNEILELRGLMLRAFIIRIIEALKEPELGEHIFLLSGAIVRDVMAITEQDKDSLLILTAKILARGGRFPQFEVGVPVNFQPLSPNIRKDIFDKLKKAQVKIESAGEGK